MIRETAGPTPRRGIVRAPLLIPVALLAAALAVWQISRPREPDVFVIAVEQTTSPQMVEVELVEATPETALEARAAFVDAINERDLERAAAFISDSVLYLNSKGNVGLSGGAAKETLTQSTVIQPGVTLRYKIEKVDRHTDSSGLDTAVLTIEDVFSSTGPSGVRTVQWGGRSIETWKKVGSTWLLVKNQYPLAEMRQ